MSDRSTPQYWLGRFVTGLLLIVLAGIGGVGKLLRGTELAGPVTVLAGFWGFYLAFSAVQPLMRFLSRQQAFGRPWASEARDQFARASLPRRVYHLLAAIASVDGPMTARERDTVRTFVATHFVGSVSLAELQSWELQPLRVEDRRGLAARIAVGLTDPELDTLFVWCCLVTFADGQYRESEHRVLQEVAAGFGLSKGRARMLFHLARAQFLRDTGGGSAPGGAPAGDVRARALAVLGLADGASPEQIRKRHRELVRRFHPDAQPNLGPVAQREATERFQEIQRAYETLTS